MMESTVELNASARDVSEQVLERIVGVEEEHVTVVRFSPNFTSASWVAICFSKNIGIYELIAEKEPGGVAHDFRLLHCFVKPFESIIDLAWDPSTTSADVPGGLRQAAFFVASPEEVVYILVDLEEKVLVKNKGSALDRVKITSIAASSLYPEVVTVGSDQFLRVFSVLETPNLGLTSYVKLSFLPRCIRFHPRLEHIVLIAGHDGHVRFYDVEGGSWIEDIKVVRGCLVSGAWHPILPSTFLACTDHGVVFYGEDKRQIDVLAAEALWCPAFPRYIAVMLMGRNEIQVYDRNEKVKQMKAPGLFSSMSWHSFLPILAVSTGHTTRFHLFSDAK